MSAKNGTATASRKTEKGAAKAAAGKTPAAKKPKPDRPAELPVVIRRAADRTLRELARVWPAVRNGELYVFAPDGVSLAFSHAEPGDDPPGGLSSALIELATQIADEKPDATSATLRVRIGGGGQIEIPVPVAPPAPLPSRPTAGDINEVLGVLAREAQHRDPTANARAVSTENGNRIFEMFIADLPEHDDD